MSWVSKKWKQVKHAVGRALGGPSHGEQRARKSLLEQEALAKIEEKARRESLIALRRSANAGRKSLLSWYDDDRNTIGA